MFHQHEAGSKRFKLACIFLSLFFKHEDGGDMFL
jgi:hypothetical protein